jgi:hypothetical protein
LLERATPARLPKQQSFRNAACVGRKPNADTLEIVKGLFLKLLRLTLKLQAIAAYLFSFRCVNI